MTVFSAGNFSTERALNELGQAIGLTDSEMTFARAYLGMLLQPEKDPTRPGGEWERTRNGFDNNGLEFGVQGEIEVVVDDVASAAEAALAVREGRVKADAPDDSDIWDPEMVAAAFEGLNRLLANRRDLGILAKRIAGMRI